MGLIRSAAVAGRFYPSEPNLLARDVRQFLDAVPTKPVAAPKAIIAPHAGYIYSGPIAASVYARLAKLRHSITRVILVGPSHRFAFHGLAASSAEAFQTPLGEIPLDREAVARLLAMPEVSLIDQAFDGEHSLEVHLPFLQATIDRFSLVPLVAGDASATEVATVLDALWGGPETLVVISSDLSHYQDYASAQTIDDGTRHAIERLDGSAISSQHACGMVPVGGLLLVARQRGLVAETVDLRNSGDTAGPRDRVVGYGAWAFTEPGAVEGPEAELRRQARMIVDLARSAIEAILGGHQIAIPQGLPPLLVANGACFVTLKKDGLLRGCVGSVEAWRPLATDILDNAVKAAFHDPRFTPLRGEEWDGLDVSVAVLTPSQPMSFTDEADLVGQLRPHIDGLIIEDGAHRAVFLPAVWEQLPVPQDFLDHLRHKAGLAPRHWSAEFRVRRFAAVELKGD